MIASAFAARVILQLSSCFQWLSLESYPRFGTSAPSMAMRRVSFAADGGPFSSAAPSLNSRIPEPIICATHCGVLGLISTSAGSRSKLNSEVGLAIMPAAPRVKPA